jgi:hypothetical protein
MFAPGDLVDHDTNQAVEATGGPARWPSPTRTPGRRCASSPGTAWPPKSCPSWSPARPKGHPSPPGLQLLRGPGVGLGRAAGRSQVETGRFIVVAASLLVGLVQMARARTSGSYCSYSQSLSHLLHSKILEPPKDHRPDSAYSSIVTSESPEGAGSGLARALYGANLHGHIAHHGHA